MANELQNLLTQLQQQTGLSPQQLLMLLQNRGGSGVSSRGFRPTQADDVTGFNGPPPGARTAPQPGPVSQPGTGDLTDRLSGIFSGFGDLNAEDLDRLQLGSKALGFLGPLGSAANFGIGQVARVAANKAFPQQQPIGFFEDILTPDLFGGTPFDIQRERQGVTGGQNIRSRELARDFGSRGITRDRLGRDIDRATGRARGQAGR